MNSRPDHPLSSDEFRKALNTKYLPEVELHWHVRKTLEAAFVQDRYAHELVPRALDVLFFQCFKAHISTYELASLAQVEDAATIVRRQLELAATALYICLPDVTEERERRAGTFLAFLWAKWPPESHDAIPADERAAWHAVLDRYGSQFTPNQPQWGPPFRDIFKEIDGWNSEYAAAFRKDYRYLSYVAHGTPPSLVANYGKGIVSAHDDRQVPEILLVGCSYALIGATAWNRLYQLASDARLQELAHDVALRSRRKEPLPNEPAEQ